MRAAEPSGSCLSNCCWPWSKEGPRCRDGEGGAARTRMQWLGFLPVSPAEASRMALPEEGSTLEEEVPHPGATIRKEGKRASQGVQE